MEHAKHNSLVRSLLSRRRLLMRGVTSSVFILETYPHEIETIANYLKELEDTGTNLEDVCLVTRTNSLLSQYEGALKAKGIHTESEEANPKTTVKKEYAWPPCTASKAWNSIKSLLLV